jgi:hypothetical protein
MTGPYRCDFLVFSLLPAFLTVKPAPLTGVGAVRPCHDRSRLALLADRAVMFYMRGLLGLLTHGNSFTGFL